MAIGAVALPAILTANERNVISQKLALLTNGVSSCLMYVADPAGAAAPIGGLEIPAVEEGKATENPRRGPIDRWVFDATPNNLNDLSSSDAERRALSEIGRLGNWGTPGSAWAILPVGATLYVLGTKGPCSDCRRAVPQIAKQLNAALQVKWIYTRDPEENKTIGGSNGFSNAVQVQLNGNRAAWVKYSTMFAPFAALLPGPLSPVLVTAINQFFDQGKQVGTIACGSSGEAGALANLLGVEMATNILRGAWKREGNGWTRA